MRVEALTFFRFLAAIIVVIFHYGKKTEIANLFHPFITSGPEMVTFFFTLSGFVLMISHYHKTDETLGDYYISRIARILPVYMLALLVMVYFNYGAGNNNAISLLLSALFIQSWFPPYPLSLNGPGWSLSVEAFFYITFPLIIFLIKQSQIKTLKLVLLSVGFYIFTQAVLSNLMTDKFYNGFPSASHDLIYYFPLSHYCSFLLGVTGGYVFIKNNKLFLKEGVFPLIIMILVLYITYFFIQNPRVIRDFAGIPLAYGSSFYSLLFISMILGIAHSKNYVTKFLSLPFFVLLGESSYAFYILQMPVYVAYDKYILVHLDLSVNNSFYLYMLILILISILVFRFIEKPGKILIFNLNNFFNEKLSNKLNALGSKKIATSS
jgi:peptidoglycan/LPS O-acetylase OafA/YrhL